MSRSSEWAEEQWKEAKLGDRRLTNRAIKIAVARLETSQGSLPGKFQGWE